MSKSTKGIMIMRTTHISLLGSIALAALTACTVNEVDVPPLSGPSSLARTILMIVDRDTLLQDGQQEAAIQLRAIVQPGQSENVRLHAQVFVDGVPQYFGTLSNKSPITPTTIFYRAPASTGQTSTTVSIVVTPTDSGDFKGETSRQVDIRLIPPGVILPVNPNLIASFTFTPATPRVLDTVTFNASTTTNGGTACGQLCSYEWNFGDGTTGSGQVITHQYRSISTFPVALTVTDQRGATAQTIQPVPVSAAAPPTVTFTTSPTEVNVGDTLFFNASESKAAEGRVLVDYFWDFGDGTTASGSAVSHIYAAAGTYMVTLKVTDDAGTFTVSSQSVTVDP